MKLINLVHATQICKLIPDWEDTVVETVVAIPLPDDFEFPPKYVAKLTSMGWALKDGVLSIGEEKTAKRRAKKKDG